MWHGSGLVWLIVTHHLSALSGCIASLNKGLKSSELPFVSSGCQIQKSRVRPIRYNHSCAASPRNCATPATSMSVLVLLCMLARKCRQINGTIAGTFVTLYAISRFTVEFTRQPDDQIGFVAYGWLTMGQLLSVLMRCDWNFHHQDAQLHESPRQRFKAQPF